MHDLMDPFDAVTAWYADAVRAEADVPDAMQLATVDAEGRPTVRTVLLKEFGREQGFVFYTNLGSRKSADLFHNGRAAGVLHWKSLFRQVTVEGRATRLPDAVADAYFATRPRESQVGAWASLQSQLLPSRALLEERVALFEDRFQGRDVPRPEGWGGFSIDPERIELWQGRMGRLHDRLVFRREGAGWVREWWYP